MKTISRNKLERFIGLTSQSSYDEFLKERYWKLGQEILKYIVYLMELKKGEYEIRWNPGGIAVSGDHTLHTDKFYLALHDNCGLGSFYYRTCKGMRDFSGGPNQIYSWNELLDGGLISLVNKLKEIQFAT